MTEFQGWLVMAMFGRPAEYFAAVFNACEKEQKGSKK